MSVLIIGPSGKTILYDFGNYSASKRLIPYLKSIGITAARGLDIAILSHYDLDHYRGYLGLIKGGYDINEANFGPYLPSRAATMLHSYWVHPAKKTSAGDVQAIRHNQVINLGHGAQAKVAAVNGKLFDGRQYTVKNNNDKSVVLYIYYRNFQMILDGDIGGGKEECTGLGTLQVAMQPKIADALIENNFVDREMGVEVMNVAHHGSHSSTTAAYFAQMNPQVAVISVGNPNKKYQHPRAGVVDLVLLQGHKNCDHSVAAEPAVVFRTDDGTAECEKRQTHPNECSSNSGTRCGDIKLTTNGKEVYRLSCSGRVWNGKKRDSIINDREQVFTLDEAITTP